MSKAILISRLEQQLDALYQKYSQQKEKKIYAKFPPTLFSENYETFAFYWAELNKTLEQIKSIPLEKEEELNFFCNKLIGQYRVLQESLRFHSMQKNIKKRSKIREPATVYSAKERQQQRDNSLPPRERLTKYYTYLNAFNDKIKALEDVLFQTTDELNKTKYEQLLINTKERRLKCLNAIEIL